jgi:hypothetical protein
MKTLRRLVISCGLVLIAYLGSYFLVMAPGIAIDETFTREEYNSVSRFARRAAVPCPRVDRVAMSHWTNPLFEPLDLIFRTDQLRKTI